MDHFFGFNGKTVNGNYLKQQKRKKERKRKESKKEQGYLSDYCSESISSVISEGVFYLPTKVCRYESCFQHHGEVENEGVHREDLCGQKYLGKNQDDRSKENKYSEEMYSKEIMELGRNLIRL